MNNPVSMQLQPLGRLTWAQMRGLLDGCTCTWTDIGGLQVGSAPDEPPTTSHLWAWSADRYVRVRLDDDHAYGAVLYPSGKPDDVTATETVDVTVRGNVRTWKPNDPQAGPVPSDVHAMTFDLLEVAGPRTPGAVGSMTFVRARQIVA